MTNPTAGRPFVVEGQARIASVSATGGWSDAIVIADLTLSPAERGEVAEHYLGMALAEHASIASFARFALQLLSVGAPSDLVEGCARAMSDETRHARFAFAVVEQLVGSPVAPGELNTTDAASHGDSGLRSSSPSLREIVRLAIREGAIGETLASVELALSAELASPPWLSKALRGLADDEARHAELAFRFVAWALQSDVSLQGVIDEELSRPVSWVEEPPRSKLEAWGILTPRVRAQTRADALALVVRPLLTFARREHASAARS